MQDAPRISARGLRLRAWVADLPEEVLDHIDDMPAVDVDQQRIVIIADPAIGAVGRWQAILPRIVDPVVLAVQHRRDVHADREAAITIAPAARRVITRHAIGVAVRLAVVPPIVPPVVAPTAVPLAIVVAVPAAIVVAPVAIVGAAVLAEIPPVVAAIAAEIAPVLTALLAEFWTRQIALPQIATVLAAILAEITAILATVLTECAAFGARRTAKLAPLGAVGLAVGPGVALRRNVSRLALCLAGLAALLAHFL